MNSRKYKSVIHQVPPDYYEKGVKTNVLQKYWHSRKWDKLKEFLINHQKGNLLDIGCADGTTIYEIYRNFPNLKITGIDYHKKAIDFAKKTKPQINFLVADAHELPFKNNSFDLVSAIETLEHLHKPEIAMAEIHRVLRPQGHLIVGQDTDSLLFRSIWWFWTKWKGSVWTDSHLSCVEPKVLVKNIKKSGFKVKKVDYINLNMEIFIKAQKA